MLYPYRFVMMILVNAVVTRLETTFAADAVLGLHFLINTDLSLYLTEGPQSEAHVDTKVT